MVICHDLQPHSTVRGDPPMGVCQDLHLTDLSHEIVHSDLPPGICQELQLSNTAQSAVNGFTPVGVCQELLLSNSPHTTVNDSLHLDVCLDLQLSNSDPIPRKPDHRVTHSETFKLCKQLLTRVRHLMVLCTQRTYRMALRPPQ